MKTTFYVKLSKKLNSKGEPFKYVRASINNEFMFVWFSNCDDKFDKLKVDYNYFVDLGENYKLIDFNDGPVLWVNDFKVISYKPKAVKEELQQVTT